LLTNFSLQIAIRIAGIDAPEGAHFGNQAQPHSTEALTWLRNYILNRRVRARIYKRDQYDRIVATVYVRRGLLRRNVGLEMLKAGLATVYEAKSGAEFGDLEARYRRAESWAKLKRKGIWSGNQKDFESPREYKNRISTANNSKQEVVKAVVTALTSPHSQKS
jgi:endonuclease YncB( thermonuclease family)